MKARGLFLVLSLTFFLNQMIYAGHPLTTDDAYTVGYMHPQFELYAEYNFDAGIRQYAFPFVATFGLLDNLDAVVELPYLRCYEGSRFQDHGIGDIAFNLKYNIGKLFDADIALKPGFSIPAGDYEKGHGTGQATYSMGLAVSREVSTLTFHLNVNYVRNRNLNDEELNLWDFSLAAELPLYERLTLAGEVYTCKNADCNAGGNPAYTTLGLVYSLTDFVDLDIGYQTGINEYQPRSGILTGITVAL